jgi:hypothetical protein
MSNDRIRDENYDDHCPECNGTDFSWIDYNPDTAAGQKNREKFCQDWDPADALDKIFLVPHETGTDDPVDFPIEEIAVKAKWPF